MSSTALYKLYKTKVTLFAELRNSYGSAPVIWGYLCEKYLNTPSHSWVMGNVDRLWALSNDSRIPEHLRIVHSFCMDWAVCEPRDIQKLVDACKKSHEEFKVWRPDHVNHWKIIGEEIEKLNLDKKCQGIVIGCTSVSDPWEGCKKEHIEQAWNCIRYALNVREAA